MSDSLRWRRVAWLFLWTTLAFWSGCAGENQNYEINDQTTPMFQESYPTAPGEGGVNAAPLDIETHDSDAEVAVDPMAPSLANSHDRSHWRREVVIPARGLTPHHPHYFDVEGYGERWLVTEDRPSPVYRNQPDIETMATQVTAGARRSVTWDDAGDFALSTTKPLVDIVAMPYLMYRDHPWAIQLSPR